MSTGNKVINQVAESAIENLDQDIVSNLREVNVLGALANPSDVTTITFNMWITIDEHGKFALEYDNLMDIVRHHVLSNEEGHSTYQDRYLNTVETLLKEAYNGLVGAEFSNKNAELQKVGDDIESVHLGLISSSPDFNEPSFEYEDMESEEAWLGIDFKIDEDLTIHIVDNDDGKGFNRLDYVGLSITDLTILIREW